MVASNSVYDWFESLYTDTIDNLTYYNPLVTNPVYVDRWSMEEEDEDDPIKKGIWRNTMDNWIDDTLDLVGNICLRSCDELVMKVDLDPIHLEPSKTDLGSVEAKH